MDVTYSTRGQLPSAGQAGWSSAVARTYFPLRLVFRSAGPFRGALDVWSFGEVSLSRNASDPLLYVRDPAHLVREREESFLVTIPERAEISFLQAGREVRCKPGGFIVERSHLPYEFGHAEANDLLVLKIPAEMLKAHLAVPDRLASVAFDAGGGVGALFADMVRIAARRAAEMDETARRLVGRQLVALFVRAVETDERILASGSTAVRAAHLARAEDYIRAHLDNPALSPQTVADACGISVRYLHHLFHETETSVCAFVREQRLLAAHEALSDPKRRTSIATLAYTFGFGGPAQFSRHYRAMFGRPPSETRAATRHSHP
jgi:AraC-like DNA-binding protein